MISYCVDINYEDIYRSLPTIFGDYEYEHYIRIGHGGSSHALCYIMHPELQFIAIF